MVENEVTQLSNTCPKGYKKNSSWANWFKLGREESKNEDIQKAGKANKMQKTYANERRRQRSSHVMNAVKIMKSGKVGETKKQRFQKRSEFRVG